MTAAGERVIVRGREAQISAIRSGRHVSGVNGRNHGENASVQASRSDAVDRAVGVKLDRRRDPVRTRHVTLDVGDRTQPAHPAQCGPFSIKRIAQGEVLTIECGSIVGEQDVFLIEELILAARARGGLSLRAGQCVGGRVTSGVHANCLVIRIHVPENLRHAHRSIGRQSCSHVGFDQRESRRRGCRRAACRRADRVELLNQTACAEALHVVDRW